MALFGFLGTSLDFYFLTLVPKFFEFLLGGLLNLL